MHSTFFLTVTLLKTFIPLWLNQKERFLVISCMLANISTEHCHTWIFNHGTVFKSFLHHLYPLMLKSWDVMLHLFLLLFRPINIFLQMAEILVICRAWAHECILKSIWVERAHLSTALSLCTFTQGRIFYFTEDKAIFHYLQRECVFECVRVCECV